MYSAVEKEAKLGMCTSCGILQAELINTMYIFRCDCYVVFSQNNLQMEDISFTVSGAIQTLRVISKIICRI